MIDTTTLPTLGDRLKACRTAKGWTLAQVADRCRIGVPYLSKLENDRERPSFLVLVRLAGAYGERTADLAAIPGVDRAMAWLDAPTERDAEAEAIVSALVGALVSASFTSTYGASFPEDPDHDTKD
jgi:transcriptional regulator with XRE-family HTH domain